MHVTQLSPLALELLLPPPPLQVSYTAHALTLEDYMPLALSRDLSGPQALQQHASALGATLLLCWELIRCCWPPP